MTNGTRPSRHAKGALIIGEGTLLDEWIVIESGVVSLCTGIAGTRVAVATLWRGDLLGHGSPLGKERARFDVRALGEVTTLRLPAEQAASLLGEREQARLAAATDERLQDQIFMRLAGNGLQRLVSVLATLATALSASAPRGHASSQTLALPLVQSCLGELSGLSRRQAWIYLGQLAESGWARTSRTRILLDGIEAWLALPAEVAREGLACIATLELCTATLERLSRRLPLHAVAPRAWPLAVDE
ncbi:Crp/Fnr family transcriptional regulator [Pelomonas sp. KK5]|uniref:Crp/Fnr family transcriptional regulator n=1 Tax=Pelomonas sp. KK5 TaxID=1855730 RepID=UPI00097BE14A|nr:cyclic nucleotide-binding domain-containing protein [Pelomonas sp. KK5]